MGTRILVVGAGVAGLSLARVLRSRGLETELVERSVDWPVAGAGIYIPGNGLRALRELGLGDEVEAAAVVVARRRLLDDTGRLLIDFDESGLWRDVAPPVALHRRELHDILLRGAAGTPIRLVFREGREQRPNVCPVGATLDSESALASRWQAHLDFEQAADPGRQAEPVQPRRGEHDSIVFTAIQFRDARLYVAAHRHDP